MTDSDRLVDAAFGAGYRDRLAASPYPPASAYRPVADRPNDDDVQPVVGRAYLHRFDPEPMSGHRLDPTPLDDAA